MLYIPYLVIIVIVTISFYLKKYIDKHQCPKCGSFHTHKQSNYLHCYKCKTSTNLNK